MQSASGPMRKVGAFALAHSKYVIVNGYNFGRGGCSNTRSTLSGYATELLVGDCASRVNIGVKAGTQG